jgi:hypothetical protein
VIYLLDRDRERTVRENDSSEIVFNSDQPVNTGKIVIKNGRLSLEENLFLGDSFLLSLICNLLLVVPVVAVAVLAIAIEISFDENDIITKTNKNIHTK